MPSSPWETQRQGGVLAQERSPHQPQLGVELHRQQLRQPPDPAGQAVRHGQLQLCGSQRGQTEDLTCRPRHCLQ